MQPQLIRPAWTFCRAASPRRPGDRITVLLLRCRSPPLAQSGHASRVARCPLSGVKRTSASVTARGPRPSPCSITPHSAKQFLCGLCSHVSGCRGRRAERLLSLRVRDQLRQLLARVEHTRFHRGLVDADNLGDLLDRFTVIVNEIDDLAVLGRQPSQGAPQQFLSLSLLKYKLRVVRRVRNAGRKFVV